MAEISPLRRRMIEDMTVRNLSPATQQSYLNAVSKFSRYFGRSPDRLGLEDVHAFQVHLVATGISWPALNQIVCALRFFYGVTLGQTTVPERIAYAREPSKLPVVLSADEIVRFLEAIPSLKSRTALTTVYAAGLRAASASIPLQATLKSGPTKFGGIHSQFFICKPLACSDLLRRSYSSSRTNLALWNLRVARFEDIGIRSTIRR